MSILNPDVTSIRSRRLLHWSQSAKPLAAISTAAGNRDLTAVVVLSTIGLVVSLFFVLLFPGSLSAFIAQLP